MNPTRESVHRAPAAQRSGSWLTPAWRLRRVAQVLAKHGFGEIAARAGMPSSLPRRFGDDTITYDRRRVATRVAQVLADLGPTYIKLGQLLATRGDLLQPEVTQALATLHSHVPPMRPHVLQRAVEEEIGTPISRAFVEFDLNPIAAASIGQVHRARLASGEEVAVKVRRPQLERTVVADLALIRAAAGLLAQAVPAIAALDPLALVAAFERSILAELDFRLEAGNARRMGRLLANAAEVRVPKIYDEWTRPGILVMELITGRKLSELAPIDRTKARDNLLRAFTRQILDHGVFHADPHPGNVLVERDGRIVLLDLGAVDSIDPALRSGLLRLVRAMVLGHSKALCGAVLALSPDGGKVSVDRARLEAEIQGIVTEATGGNGAEVLNKMVSLGQTHRLRMPPALLTLVRALALLDGVLRGLDPARNLVSDMRRELAATLARRLGRLLNWLLGPIRWSIKQTLGTVEPIARKLRGSVQRALDCKPGRLSGTLPRRDSA